MGHPYWPLFDLVIRTPRLELRPPTDDDVVAIVALALSAGTPAASASPLSQTQEQAAATRAQIAALDALPRPSGDRYQDMKHLTGIGPVRDAD